LNIFVLTKKIHSNKREYKMTKLVILIFLFINQLSINAQNIDKLNKENYYPLSKNTFISITEISNKDYNSFLEYYSGDVSMESLSIKNNLWVDNEMNLPMGLMNKDLYHSTKKWENHPVVNISQEAAKTYCEWLTEQYNSNSDREYKKVVFRLPTEKEWMKAFKKVKNKIDVQTEQLHYSEKYPCKKRKLNDEEKKLKEIHVNKKPSPESFMKLAEIDMSKVVNDYPARPVAFFREKYEAPIYNLVGNVSEWLNEGEQVIASNWNVKNDKSIKELIASNKAESPSPLIGFRIIMEVIEK